MTAKTVGDQSGFLRARRRSSQGGKRAAQSRAVERVVSFPPLRGGRALADEIDEALGGVGSPRRSGDGE